MKTSTQALLILGALLLGGAASASFINYSSKEINVKIVYEGPSTAELLENLQYIYNKTDPELKGKMISLETESDRTVFFDFIPKGLGEIRGFKVRFHLYTVPGKVFYEASKKLLLKGVDGIVFVADCDEANVERTLESWERLKALVKEQGYDWSSMPIVVQFEHNDHPKAMKSEEMKKLLGLTNQPSFEAVTSTGVGVFDTLKAVAKLTLLEMKAGSKSSVGEAASESRGKKSAK